ncbi:MAG TPA: hypothetical protein VHB73_00535, partial [Alphaproteobacteria bacterium]|nr:hypothetical protein [Alphaproteobacteria bacterium]
MLFVFVLFFCASFFLLFTRFFILLLAFCVFFPAPFFFLFMLFFFALAAFALFPFGSLAAIFFLIACFLAPLFFFRALTVKIFLIFIMLTRALIMLGTGAGGFALRVGAFARGLLLLIHPFVRLPRAVIAHV